MGLKQGSAMPRRAYSYLRWSSKKQSKGYSYKRQIRYAPRLCKRKGWTLDDSREWVDEACSAYTGKNVLCGVLGQFLEAVRSGEIPPGSVLIIENFDRLSRRSIDAAFELVRALWLAGITVYTVSPEKEYPPESINSAGDRDEVSRILNRAHEESKRKSFLSKANWRKIRQRARKRGRATSKNCCKWCRVVKRRVVPIPERVEMVKAILRMAREGYSLNDLGRFLNSHLSEYPPLGKSKQWSTSTLHYLLTTRTTLGEYQPRYTTGKNKGQPAGPMIPGYYPVLQTEGEHLAILQQLAARKKRMGRPCKTSTNILTGLVHSAITQGPMHLRSSGCASSLYRYLVAAYQGDAVDEEANTQSVRFDDVEESFLHHMAELDPRKAGFVDATQAELDVRIDRLVEEQKSCDAKIASYRRKATERGLDDEQQAFLLQLALDTIKVKHDVTTELNRLKFEADTGRQENIAAFRAMCRAVLEASPEDAEALRQQAARRIRVIVEEVWILIHSESERRKVVQIQVVFVTGKWEKWQLQPKCDPGHAMILHPDVDLRTLRTVQESVASAG